MIRFSIRRPVAVTMAYVGLALLGVVSWLKLPVELLPGLQERFVARFRGRTAEPVAVLRLPRPGRSHGRGPHRWRGTDHPHGIAGKVKCGERDRIRPPHPVDVERGGSVLFLRLRNGVW